MDVLVEQSHPRDLLVYLYKLYQGRSLCDIDIETSDGVVFPTHRLVLASTSTYIHTMIFSNPNLSCLKLDLPSNVLQVLLEYGYTGQLFVSDNLQEEVRSAASFLQMYSVLNLLKKHAAGEELSCDLSKVEVNEGQGHDLVQEDGYHGDYNAAYISGLVEASIEEKPDVDIRDLEDFKTDFTDQMSLERVQQEDTQSDNIRRSRRLEIRKSDIGHEKKKGEKEKRKQQKKKSEKMLKESQSKKVTDKSRDGFSHGKAKQPEKTKSSKKSLKNEALNSHTKVHTQVKKVMKEKQKRRNKKSDIDKTKKAKGLQKMNVFKSDKHLNDFQCKSCPKGQRNLTKIAVKCSYCTEKVNFYNLHRHMSQTHGEIYLQRLFSRFLIKKSGQCKKGTNFIYWQIGPKTLFYCNICHKTFTRYSLFTLHLSKEHLSKEHKGWLRFLALRAKRKIRKNTKTDMNYTKIADNNSKKEPCITSDVTLASKVVLATEHAKKKRNNCTEEKPSKASASPKTDAIKCYLCCKDLHSAFAVRKHLEVIHKQPPSDAKRNQYTLPSLLKCEVVTCQFETGNLLDMTQHVVELHPYISHRCTVCNTVFKVSLMLQRHIVDKHSRSSRKKSGFQCNTCGRAFPRSHPLKRHEYFKHGIMHESVRVYRCDFEGCEYITSGNSSLNRHKSKHTKEKKFTCAFCGLKLKTDICHKKHVNKMHLGLRPYLCQVCGQSFGEDHELKSHFNYKHSAVKEFQCHLCDYASCSKNIYFTHLFNVHKIRDKEDKRTEYQCTLCPFKSIVQHRFRIHMNSHTNTRTYSCDLCDKTFISSNTLLTHKQWIHSENMFSCTQCEYQTKTRQKLNEHIRVQHQLKGIKPYKCPYCEFRCATGGNTRKHIKQVHRGYEIHYIRDDDLLEVARIARQTGNHSTLAISPKLDKELSDISSVGKGADRHEFQSITNFSSTALGHVSMRSGVSYKTMQNLSHTNIAQSVIQNVLQPTTGACISTSTEHDAIQSSISTQTRFQSPISSQNSTQPSISTPNPIQPNISTQNSMQPNISTPNPMEPSISTHNSIQPSISPSMVQNAMHNGISNAALQNALEANASSVHV